jgi:hypothetical protein
VLPAVTGIRFDRVEDFDLKANVVRPGLNYQFSYHRSDFQIRKIENAAAGIA